MPTMLVAWKVVAGGGLAAYLLAYLFALLKVLRGGCDLVIDDFRRTVTFPRSLGRKEVLVVPTAAVRHVEVDRVAHRSSKGYVYHSYAPTLIVAGSGESSRRERLIEWTSEARAKELAGWLCGRLGIKQEEPVAE